MSTSLTTLDPLTFITTNTLVSAKTQCHQFSIFSSPTKVPYIRSELPKTQSNLKILPPIPSHISMVNHIGADLYSFEGQLTTTLLNSPTNFALTHSNSLPLTSTDQVTQDFNPIIDAVMTYLALSRPEDRIRLFQAILIAESDYQLLLEQYHAAPSLSPQEYLLYQTDTQLSLTSKLQSIAFQRDSTSTTSFLSALTSQPLDIVANNAEIDPNPRVDPFCSFSALQHRRRQLTQLQWFYDYLLTYAGELLEPFLQQEIQNVKRNYTTQRSKRSRQHPRDQGRYDMEDSFSEDNFGDDDYSLSISADSAPLHTANPRRNNHGNHTNNRENNTHSRFSAKTDSHRSAYQPSVDPFENQIIKGDDALLNTELSHLQEVWKPQKIYQFATQLLNEYLLVELHPFNDELQGCVQTVKRETFLEEKRQAQAQSTQDSLHHRSSHPSQLSNTNHSLLSQPTDNLLRPTRHQIPTSALNPHALPHTLSAHHLNTINEHRQNSMLTPLKSTTTTNFTTLLSPDLQDFTKSYPIYTDHVSTPPIHIDVSKNKNTPKTSTTIDHSLFPNILPFIMMDNLDFMDCLGSVDQLSQLSGKPASQLQTSASSTATNNPPIPTRTPMKRPAGAAKDYLLANPLGNALGPRDTTMSTTVQNFIKSTSWKSVKYPYSLPDLLLTRSQSLSTPPSSPSPANRNPNHSPNIDGLPTASDNGSEMGYCLYISDQPHYATRNANHILNYSHLFSTLFNSNLSTSSPSTASLPSPIPSTMLPTAPPQSTHFNANTTQLLAILKHALTHPRNTQSPQTSTNSPHDSFIEPITLTSLLDKFKHAETLAQTPLAFNHSVEIVPTSYQTTTTNQNLLRNLIVDEVYPQTTPTGVSFRSSVVFILNSLFQQQLQKEYGHYKDGRHRTMSQTAEMKQRLKLKKSHQEDKNVDGDEPFDSLENDIVTVYSRISAVKSGVDSTNVLWADQPEQSGHDNDPNNACDEKCLGCAGCKRYEIIHIPTIFNTIALPYVEGLDRAFFANPSDFAECFNTNATTRPQPSTFSPEYLKNAKNYHNIDRVVEKLTTAERTMLDLESNLYPLPLHIAKHVEPNYVIKITAPKLHVLFDIAKQSTTNAKFGSGHVDENGNIPVNPCDDNGDDDDDDDDDAWDEFGEFRSIHRKTTKHHNNNNNNNNNNTLDESVICDEMGDIQINNFPQTAQNTTEARNQSMINPFNTTFNITQTNHNQTVLNATGLDGTFVPRETDYYYKTNSTPTLYEYQTASTDQSLHRKITSQILSTLPAFVSTNLETDDITESNQHSLPFIETIRLPQLSTSQIHTFFTQNQHPISIIPLHPIFSKTPFDPNPNNPNGLKNTINPIELQNNKSASTSRLRFFPRSYPFSLAASHPQFLFSLPKTPQFQPSTLFTQLYHHLYIFFQHLKVQSSSHLRPLIKTYRVQLDLSTGATYDGVEKTVQQRISVPLTAYESTEFLTQYQTAIEPKFAYSKLDGAAPPLIGVGEVKHSDCDTVLTAEFTAAQNHPALPLSQQYQHGQSMIPNNIPIFIDMNAGQRAQAQNLRNNSLNPHQSLIQNNPDQRPLIQTKNDMSNGLLHMDVSNHTITSLTQDSPSYSHDARNYFDSANSTLAGRDLQVGKKINPYDILIQSLMNETMRQFGNYVFQWYEERTQIVKHKISMDKASKDRFGELETKRCGLGGKHLSDPSSASSAIKDDECKTTMNDGTDVKAKKSEKSKTNGHSTKSNKSSKMTNQSMTHSIAVDEDEFQPLLLKRRFDKDGREIKTRDIFNGPGAGYIDRQSGDLYPGHIRDDDDDGVEFSSSSASDSESDHKVTNKGAKEGGNASTAKKTTKRAKEVPKKTTEAKPASKTAKKKKVVADEDDDERFSDVDDEAEASREGESDDKVKTKNQRLIKASKAKDPKPRAKARAATKQPAPTPSTPQKSPQKSIMKVKTEMTTEPGMQTPSATLKKITKSESPFQTTPNGTKRVRIVNVHDLESASDDAHEIRKLTLHQRDGTAFYNSSPAQDPSIVGPNILFEIPPHVQNFYRNTAISGNLGTNRIYLELIALFRSLQAFRNNALILTQLFQQVICSDADITTMLLFLANVPKFSPLFLSSYTTFKQFMFYMFKFIMVFQRQWQYSANRLFPAPNFSHAPTFQEEIQLAQALSNPNQPNPPPSTMSNQDTTPLPTIFRSWHSDNNTMFFLRVLKLEQVYKQQSRFHNKLLDYKPLQFKRDKICLENMVDRSSGDFKFRPFYLPESHKNYYSRTKFPFPIDFAEKKERLYFPSVDPKDPAGSVKRKTFTPVDKQRAQNELLYDLRAILSTFHPCTCPLPHGTLDGGNSYNGDCGWVEIVEKAMTYDKMCAEFRALHPIPRFPFVPPSANAIQSGSGDEDDDDDDPALFLETDEDGNIINPKRKAKSIATASKGKKRPLPTLCGNTTATDLPPAGPSRPLSGSLVNSKSILKSNPNQPPSRPLTSSTPTGAALSIYSANSNNSNSAGQLHYLNKPSNTNDHVLVGNVNDMFKTHTSTTTPMNSIDPSSAFRQPNNPIRQSASMHPAKLTNMPMGQQQHGLARGGIGVGIGSTNRMMGGNAKPRSQIGVPKLISAPQPIQPRSQQQNFPFPGMMVQNAHNQPSPAFQHQNQHQQQHSTLNQTSGHLSESGSGTAQDDRSRYQASHLGTLPLTNDPQSLVDPHHHNRHQHGNPRHGNNRQNQHNLSQGNQAPQRGQNNANQNNLQSEPDGYSMENDFDF